MKKSFIQCAISFLNSNKLSHSLSCVLCFALGILICIFYLCTEVYSKCKWGFFFNYVNIFVLNVTCFICYMDLFSFFR